EASNTPRSKHEPPNAPPHRRLPTHGRLEPSPLHSPPRLVAPGRRGARRRVLAVGEPHSRRGVPPVRAGHRQAHGGNQTSRARPARPLAPNPRNSPRPPAQHLER